MKNVKYHVTQIKEFLYDADKVDPVEVARKEQAEFEVEKVYDRRRINSTGNMRHDWEYHVHWKGYGQDEDTWEPYEGLRDNSEFHLYVYQNKLKGLLSRVQRTEVEKRLKEEKLNVI